MCQNLRKNLCDEQSRATQLKEEINTYAERLMVTTKSLQHNEEIIKKQRKEIGIIDDQLCIEDVRIDFIDR